MYATGRFTLGEIGDFFGLTHQRVQQVVVRERKAGLAVGRAEVPEDVGR